MAEWFPKRERAFAVGIFNAGSNIGAIVAPASTSAGTGPSPPAVIAGRAGPAAGAGAVAVPAVPATGAGTGLEATLPTGCPAGASRVGKVEGCAGNAGAWTAGMAAGGAGTGGAASRLASPAGGQPSVVAPVSSPA